jgi:hypothetical protein|tara:strand:+ start:1127 stop:1465 length:339 start_codon:yes stop_codon:yes gene_type:complete
MGRYANGKHAFGFCDRTGFRYKLSDLKPEFRAGVKTGLLVGKDVWDKDQPQNFLGKLGDYTDPQSLRNPRPDASLTKSRGMFAFDPVGSGNANIDANLTTQSSVGTVTIAIS